MNIWIWGDSVSCWIVIEPLLNISCFTFWQLNLGELLDSLVCVVVLRQELYHRLYHLVHLLFQFLTLLFGFFSLLFGFLSLPIFSWSFWRVFWIRLAGAERRVECWRLGPEYAFLTRIGAFERASNEACIERVEVASLVLLADWIDEEHLQEETIVDWH